MRLSLWILAGAVIAVASVSVTKTGRQVIESVTVLIGEGLKKLLAQEEGLRLDVYQDEGGRWTIGYGHLIQPGEAFHPFGPITYISQTEAEEIAANDTAIAANCVDQSVQVDITENQRDALISFVFNVGCGAFKASRLLRFLNAGDTIAAADEFQKWVKVTDASTGAKRDSSILIGRRDRERELFLV